MRWCLAQPAVTNRLRRARRGDIGAASSAWRERIAVLAAGLLAYSMAGAPARMGGGSHARSQPGHARPKSLPLARGDAAEAGPDEEQALLSAERRTSDWRSCRPAVPRELASDGGRKHFG